MHRCEQVRVYRQKLQQRIEGPADWESAPILNGQLTAREADLGRLASLSSQLRVRRTATLTRTRTRTRTRTLTLTLTLTLSLNPTPSPTITPTLTLTLILTLSRLAAALGLRRRLRAPRALRDGDGQHPRRDPVPAGAEAV